MKPNIAEMIEDLNEGDNIPSVTGIIVASSTIKIKGKDTLREYCIINDGQMDITLRIDDPGAQIIPNGRSIGDIVIATSSKTPEGNKGLTLGEKDGKPIVVIGAMAQITVEKPRKEKQTTPEPEKPKRLSAFEAEAGKIIDAKMFLYNFVKERIIAIDPDYPVEHLPAFTTSVFMDLKHANVAIPTGKISVTEHSNDREHKQAAVVEGKKPAASPKSGGWRDVKHPSSGETLGSIDVETLKKKFTSWYYCQDRANLSAKSHQFYDALGEAFAENDHDPVKAAEWYFYDYMNDYPADEAKKAKIIARFGKISAHLFNDKKKLASPAKAVQFLKEFKAMFDEAIK